MIPAAKVAGSGSLSGFPVLVTESCFGAKTSTIFGGAHHSGRDIRFSSDSAGSTQLACDIAEWDSNAETCRVWVNRDITLGSDNSIYIWYGNTSELAIARDDTYGGEAVWPKPTYDLRSESIGMDRSGLGANNWYGKVAGDPQTTFIRDTTEYAAFPSLIKLANGTLICSFREGTEHFVTVTGNIYVSSSSDDGRTWASLSSITDASYDLRDANLIQLASGDIWLTYNKVNSGDTIRTTQYVVSTDNGATWGSEQDCSVGRTKSVNRGKPIELRNGDICVPCREVSASGSIPYAAFWDGSSWMESDVLATFGNINEWTAIESTSTNNDLIGFFRNESDSDIYRAYYTHSTTSWSTPTKVITNNGHATPPEVHRLDDDSLMLIWSPDRENGYSGASRSTDDGVTWISDSSLRFCVTDLGGMGFYESACQLSNNQWGVAWYYDTPTQDDYSKVYFSRFELDGSNRLTGVQDYAGANGTVFNGTDNALANCGDTTDFVWMHQTGVFSITWRGALDSPETGRLDIVCGSTVTSVETGFHFGIEDRAVVSAQSQMRLFLAKGISGNSIIDSLSNVDAITDTDKHTLHCVGDGTNVVFYVDGVSVGGSNTMGSKVAGNATHEMDIGQSPRPAATYGHLDGSMELLSFRSDVVSTAWISAQHENLNDPPAFIAYSEELGMPFWIDGAQIAEAWVDGVQIASVHFNGVQQWP